jgi:hypothetical protein
VPEFTNNCCAVGPNTHVIGLVHDGTSASDEPIGYAIMPDRPQAWVKLVDDALATSA